jgi:hypothetical protein
MELIAGAVVSPTGHDPVNSRFETMSDINPVPAGRRAACGKAFRAIDLLVLAGTGSTRPRQERS